MLSQNQIKFVNSLKNKKYRLQHSAFIVEGEKCVDELLKSTFTVKKVFALGSWFEVNNVLLREKCNDVNEITIDELNKISDLSTPNKVLAIAQIPKSTDLKEFLNNEMVLALDGIRDPGNLGTIIRTANWFGINKIVCSPDCVDVFNSKVIQATMGSFAKTKVIYIDLLSYLQLLPSSTPVFGALLDAPDITKKKFKANGIILIGSESHGISKNLLPYINDPIHIPHLNTKDGIADTAESLNASIATAIICYEITKQLFSV